MHFNYSIENVKLQILQINRLMLPKINTNYIIDSIEFPKKTHICVGKTNICMASRCLRSFFSINQFDE